MKRHMVVVNKDQIEEWLGWLAKEEVRNGSPSNPEEVWLEMAKTIATRYGLRGYGTKCIRATLLDDGNVSVSVVWPEPCAWPGFTKHVPPRIIKPRSPSPSPVGFWSSVGTTTIGFLAGVGCTNLVWVFWKVVTSQ